MNILQTEDTICAIATAQGGAIGTIRVSGPEAITLTDRIFKPVSGKPLAERAPYTLTFGHILTPEGEIIDEVLVSLFRAPHSYTGQDSTEISCHGSSYILQQVMQLLIRQGCRAAGPGEYTQRAFLNGKMDLTQAEAVIDLIEADTADAAANAAGQVGGKLQKQLTPIYDDLTNLCSHFHAVLDYPDEDIEDFGLEQYSKSLRGDAKALYALLQTYGQGRILRQGVAAAIVGKPNVGKSSLLNALAGFDRCIVTDVPGTTRDTVEETVLLGSTRLRLIDTAGIRETADTVEAMGVRRSREAVENADLVIFVCDGSQPLDEEDQAIIDLCMEQENAVALINKTDLGSAVEPGELPFLNVIPICAKTGEGLDQLADAVDTMFENETPCDGSILTNARQFDAIRRAYEAMLRALQGLQLGVTPDAVLTDVEQAMEAMGEITGATVREDITARIFERFCVGK